MGISKRNFRLYLIKAASFQIGKQAAAKAKAHCNYMLDIYTYANTYILYMYKASAAGNSSIHGKKRTFISVLVFIMLCA